MTNKFDKYIDMANSSYHVDDYDSAIRYLRCAIDECISKKIESSI